MNEARIRRLFRVSVMLKGLHAAAECLGGIALALVSTQTMAAIVNRITQDELVENRHDFLARHLAALAGGLTDNSRHFYAFYLFSHGLVKLALVAGLLANRLWAYPASLVVLAMFIGYQAYRFSSTHSAGLLVLTVFDVFVMVLIWHEYGLMRRHGPPRR